MDRWPFVGRDAELRALELALAGLAAGRGTVALVAGEAGIGKTRLLAEVCSRAAAEGARTLWGGAVEDEGAPAFWPWTRLLRPLCDDPAAVPHVLAAGAPLAAIFPDCSHRPAASPSPAPDRFRLYDCVVALLRELSSPRHGGRPLVLAMDDLHWADPASLRLLEFVARDCARLPVLLLGAFRDDALPAGQPLAATLAALARLPHARRLTLGGLTAPAIAELLRALPGVIEQTAMTLHARTGGNPFFVLEVARLLPAGRDAVELARTLLPATVRDAAGQRLARLSPASRGALERAAVAGETFDVASLDSGQAEQAQLLDMLEAAEQARLIVEAENQPGHFRFGHAIVRETLLAAMPAARRMRLHRDIAAALARAPEPATLRAQAAIAAHLLSGGRPLEAAAHARRAARVAEADGAYEEAARLLELARDAAVDDGAVRAELLLELAGVRRRAGLPARQPYLDAAAQARAAGRADLLAAAALGSVEVWGSAFSVDAAIVALLEDALQVLPPNDSPERACLLAALSRELHFAGERARIDRLSAAALAMAQRLGDMETRFYALRHRHFALLGPASLEARLAISEEAGSLASQLPDPRARLWALTGRMQDLMEAGQLPEARAVAERYASLAETVREPFCLFWAAAWRSTLALIDGRMVVAAGHAADSAAVATRGNLPAGALYSLAQRLFVLREQGRAAELLPEIAPFAVALAHVPEVVVLQAVAALDAGDTATARAAYERLAADGFAAVAGSDNTLTTAALLAGLCAAFGDTTRAPLLAQLLAPAAGRLVTAVNCVSVLGPGEQYLGVLAAVMGHWQQAVAYFTAASAVAERLRAPGWLAHARLGLARALLARSGADDATRARALLAQVRQSAALGFSAPAAQATAPAARPAGLSAREVEVLRLLAAGATNQEIAAALTISPFTAGRHLSNIYTKLGVHGRAAAVTYAHRHGLL